MKKIISHREKLLELAKIYSIAEIKNYIKNKKKLTTLQLELILKKNKVPIPTEINKSIFEIIFKKATKPFHSLLNNLNNFSNELLKKIYNLGRFSLLSVKKIFLSVYSQIIKSISFVGKTTVDILNKAYNFKVEERKANKVVSSAVIVAFLFITIIGGVQFKKIIYDKIVTQETADDKRVSTQKKEIVKAPIKETVKKKEVVKAPIKEPVKKQEKKSQVVKEFVLPDLNLRTETVLSLFADVKYDLNKVRKDKLVKPIYFTQFPKDLDEITSVKLKKETFIKIVLPLVVAENEKIILDRMKLQNILERKITSEKEKLWLRQKLKEYKVKKSSMSELEKRMDIIPISIAIAQAAKESGWGTSRFALEGNAIFGQWTWNGTGIEPLERKVEQSHKILRFPILRASVKAYKNNLNTHKSYREFREKRSKLRKRNKSITGIKLIHMLDSYAETGVEYTKVLAKMMKQNALEDFENVKLTNSMVKKELNL